MLLRRHAEGVVAIGQPAHAWVSGQIARAWGNDRFALPEPWEEVCLGAEQHDIGMALWDTAPELNPETGRPYSFVEMPLETHLELWSAAPHRLRAQSRYAALLVSLHGTTLYERRDLNALEPPRRALVEAYLEEQRALQRELLAALRADPESTGADAATVERNRKLLFAWDHLSLALCLEWAPDTIADVPALDGPAEIVLSSERTLEPWPFADERVELQAEGRLLRGTFSDAASMQAALDEAPWLTLRFALQRETRVRRVSIARG